jgi:hypothetical protein
MNRFLLAKHAEDRAPSGCGPQTRSTPRRRSLAEQLIDTALERIVNA